MPGVYGRQLRQLGGRRSSLSGSRSANPRTHGGTTWRCTIDDSVGPANFNLEPRRQWWGVYSVRAHMDMRALAREILLYDRLVLPVPEDLDEADRWDDQGWDTRQLDYVAKHLGDLVHLVPWSHEMRSAWN